jgi:heat shock protein HslJ
MKRIVATLGLAVVAAVSTLGGAMAQDASPVASPSASAGIPPIVWISDDFTPTTDSATPVEGAIALGSEYWIQFLPDGQLSLRADCNGGFGSYEMDGSNLTLGPIGTTLMLCPEGGSGDAFLQALNQVTSWSIDQSGASDSLVLGLADGSSISFSPSLTGVVWQWAGTQMSNDTEIVPTNPERYYLSFSSDGSVVGQIDCNRAFGSYTADDTRIVMMLATTRVFCGEDSQDTAYALSLAQVTSFVIRDGQLALALPMDAGIIIFDPIVE